MKYGGPLGCEIRDITNNKTVRFDAVPHVNQFANHGALKRVSGKSNPIYYFEKNPNHGKYFRKFSHLSSDFQSDGFADHDKLDEKLLSEDNLSNLTTFPISIEDYTSVTQSLRNITVEWKLHGFNPLEKDLLYRIHSPRKTFDIKNEPLDLNDIEMDHDYPILTCILVTCFIILFFFVLCKLFILKCIRGFIRKFIFTEYN